MEVRDLRKRFGGLTAIDDLSLTFFEGELRCIIGPNGAGKSTLFNLITGAVKPDSGQIYFDGKNITGHSVHEIAQMGIVRKFQITSLFNSLTVLQNLLVAMVPKQPSVKMAFQSWDADDRELTQQLHEILRTVRLIDRRHEPAGNLSHGEQQWLEIGMVLAARPRLILLDEPTAGMTSIETERTAELIKTIARSATVIVIEHDMQFVRKVAQTVTVLHQGRVLCEGTVAEVERDARVRDVYLGRHEGLARP